MLDFSGNDEKAELVALYYARQFNNVIVLEILNQPRGVQNEAEAFILAKFFWDMLDASAFDKENGIVVLDEPDLQYWMERLLNIIGGYLDKGGYGAIFDKVTDGA